VLVVTVEVALVVAELDCEVVAVLLAELVPLVV
jgi:hypothetical protein